MNYGHIADIVLSEKSSIPQSRSLSKQIENSSHSFCYTINDWQLLERFLILGAKAGTYYVKQVPFTEDCVYIMERLLERFGSLVVDRIVEISESGRAAKNDPALFALAIAASCSHELARKAALAVFPRVVRTGAHLLMFTQFVHARRGWGRGLRRAVAKWFLDMPADQLVLHAVKYVQREGWSLRDVLRLSHPKVKDADHIALIDWIVHPSSLEAYDLARRRFRLLAGKYEAEKAKTPDAIAEVVHRYALPQEVLSAEDLDCKEVWESLLITMPMMMMVRNLGKMTSLNLFHDNSQAVKLVINRLLNKSLVLNAGIHPVQLLIALKIYVRGRGGRGGQVWQPVPEIVNALTHAFYSSFELLESTGKNILLGIDVSRSMIGTPCVGTSALDCVDAAAVIGMIFSRAEKNIETVIFDTQARPINMSADMKFEQVRSLLTGGSGTDIAQPILYALKHNIKVDTFVIVTDNEAWAGSENPAATLRRYRKKINPKARIAILACAANRVNICDPSDPMAFGAAGFDAAVSRLVSDFIACDNEM